MSHSSSFLLDLLHMSRLTGSCPPIKNFLNFIILFFFFEFRACLKESIAQRYYYCIDLFPICFFFCFFKSDILHVFRDVRIIIPLPFFFICFLFFLNFWCEWWRDHSLWPPRGMLFLLASSFIGRAPHTGRFHTIFSSDYKKKNTKKFFFLGVALQKKSARYVRIIVEWQPVSIVE